MAARKKAKPGRKRNGQFKKGSAAARAAGRKGACATCRGRKAKTKRKTTAKRKTTRRRR